MKKIGLLLIFLTSLSFAHAQSTKLLAEAQRLFAVKNYDQAIPAYDQAIQAGATDPVVYYQAGVCYFNSQDINVQLKGIS